MTTKRTLSLFAAFLAFAFAAPAIAQCGSVTDVVTTNGYDAEDTSEKVDTTCACATFDSGNADKLLMGCNGQDGDGQETSLVSTGAELDYYLVCEKKSDDTWAIKWKVPATWDGTIESWDVDTDSTGKKYVVSAKCRPTGSTSAEATTKLLLGDGMKNNLGALARNF